MLTPLQSLLVRFVSDPESFQRQQPHSVLVFEARRDDGREEDSAVGHRLKTVSGITRPFSSGGELLVAQVHKQKDNAFPRGVTLGRTGNNDVVIDDSSVSRFHCWMQQAPDGRSWTVVDAGSKNGTSVDGVRLRPKKPLLLKGQERLVFGEVRAQFLMPGDFFEYLRRLSDVSVASK